MKTIHIALPFLLVAAATGPAQTNVAGHFAGTSATISNTLSVAGGDARGIASFAHGYSLATGDYAVALGFGAMALHSNTFVWADRANPPVFSTGPGQFIVHATNGIFLLGGNIYGNASGLTGINVNAIGGLGSAALLPAEAFATAAQGQTADTAYGAANSALQSDGRVPWTGGQNAGGESLTNLQAAYAYAVTQATNSTSSEVLVGLRISPIEGGGPPPPACGDYYGSPEEGFYRPEAIVTDNGYTLNARLTRDGSGSWTLAWTEDTRAYATPLWDEYGWGSFWYPRYGVQMTTMAVWDYGPDPTCIVAWDGPCPGGYEFYGDVSTGFFHSDGNKCFFPEDGAWWFQHVFDDWHAGFTAADLPDGDYANVGSLQGMTYSFHVAPILQTVSGSEIVPVTNAVPFETADGRYAWIGNHNAGGFDLGNVRMLQAQSVFGDGSGLSNVGLTALDVASVDLRYLRKSGDTVAGDLEVNGALTVGGRPVATLTHLPQQGDISMGTFTNRPPEP